MSVLSEVEMQKAIEIRDKSSDGLFFYGVITTGIFCPPSCPSKAAKHENIRLFLTIQDAMIAGFRPCKRCHPVNKNTQEDKLIEIARYIEEHADEKITLKNLSEIAILSPSKLQKEFKKIFSLSPKVYQDAVRMRLYKRSLKNGEGVTDAIYSAGFGSISRIYGEPMRNLGMDPKTYRAGGSGEIIYYACRFTDLGFMMMAATNKGVCSVHFSDDENKLLSQLKAEFPKAELVASPSKKSLELDIWMERLNQHISQNAPRPNLPFDIKGTVFQIQVWTFLLSIKEGDALSYGEVAEKIGSPQAARAVGTACGKNNIAVLIPCHRVLRGDGGLGGYRWGLERKRALLDKEKNNKQS